MDFPLCLHSLPVLEIDEGLREMKRPFEFTYQSFLYNNIAISHIA